MFRGIKKFENPLTEHYFWATFEDDKIGNGDANALNS